MRANPSVGGCGMAWLAATVNTERTGPMLEIALVAVIVAWVPVSLAAVKRIAGA